MISEKKSRSLSQRQTFWNSSSDIRLTWNLLFKTGIFTFCNNALIFAIRKTTPTIRGTVITAGDKYIGQQLEKNAQILDLSDHIILLSDFEAQRNNFFATAVFQAAAYDRIKAKLIIDNNSGVLYNALYSHIGNRLREAGQSFFISRSNQFLAEIKNGDAIEINLQTGKYRRIFVK